MTTLLPLDANQTPLPALRLKDNGAHTINASNTSQKNTSAFDAETQIISVYATGPIYVNFGGSSVTATTRDHYFPEGIYYDFSIGGKETKHHSHIAVLRASYDCDVYISEKC